MFEFDVWVKVSSGELAKNIKPNILTYSMTKRNWNSLASNLPMELMS